MTGVIKLLLLACLSVFPLICFSAENQCNKKLNEFGITIVESASNSGNPRDRVIEFVFDGDYQTEEQRQSSVFVKYKAHPNFYMKTALFVGSHENPDPFNKNSYIVFIDKHMLPFLTLEIVYVIDSKYPNSYLDVFVSGFDDIGLLKCRKIKH